MPTGLWLARLRHKLLASPAPEMAERQHARFQQSGRHRPCLLRGV